MASRTYVRHRDTLIQTAGSLVQRMQKALVQMNLQLHVVVSDIGIAPYSALGLIAEIGTDMSR